MIFINVLLLSSMIGVLYILQRKQVSFTRRVFIAMVMGISFGAILQWVYGADSTIIGETTQWFNIIGGGYVRLLKMIVVPLIMVSIISALVNVNSIDTVFKQGVIIIIILMMTTGSAAGIGIVVSNSFDLSAEHLLADVELAQGSSVLDQKLEVIEEKNFPQRIVEMIPENIVMDMSGARPTSTIGVVIFSTFVGLATLQLLTYREKEARLFIELINAVHGIVMQMVDMILVLTPYGVLALMANTIAKTNMQGMVSLANFVFASYLALAGMFVIHLILLMISGVHPMKYLRKAVDPLSFAFSSRSSAGTIPLNIETQQKKLGVPGEIANLAASFGATIGQNGCGGIYPAMLAVMVAPVVGINPMEGQFVVQLILVIIISSFGVAGVGGGATFAALLVLSSMNLPVEIVAVLISVDPLIDMGRTALNVNGSMVAGVLTAQLSNKLDKVTFNS